MRGWAGLTALVGDAIMKQQNPNHMEGAEHGDHDDLYPAENRGFTSQELQACMDALFSGKTQEQRPLKDLERGMKALKGEELTLKDRAILKMLHSAMKREDKGTEGPQVGFRPDAPWLPFWHTEMCEGSIRPSQTLRRLSEAFRTPVLAFALFDSDVLFVSYRDDAGGEAYDYAKLPWEEYEEYDDETYAWASRSF